MGACIARLRGPDEEEAEARLKKVLEKNRADRDEKTESFNLSRQTVRQLVESNQKQRVQPHLERCKRLDGEIRELSRLINNAEVILTRKAQIQRNKETVQATEDITRHMGIHLEEVGDAEGVMDRFEEVNDNAEDLSAAVGRALQASSAVYDEVFDEEYLSDLLNKEMHPMEPTSVPKFPNVPEEQDPSFAEHDGEEAHLVGT